MNPLQEIVSMYQAMGHEEYLGEAITQLHHALQCAQNAKNQGKDDEVIAAALLHDIGHLCMHSQEQKMGGFGVKKHEAIGADYLRKAGFSERVAALVEGHVDAKRYLTYKYPEYLQELSPASLETLRYQGGPMTTQEALAFEQSPYFKEKLEMRRMEEDAKKVGIPVASFEDYLPILASALSPEKLSPL